MHNPFKRCIALYPCTGAVLILAERLKAATWLFDRCRALRYRQTVARAVRRKPLPPPARPTKGGDGTTAEPSFRGFDVSLPPASCFAF